MAIKRSSISMLIPRASRLAFQPTIPLPWARISSRLEQRELDVEFLLSLFRAGGFGGREHHNGHLQVVS